MGSFSNDDYCKDGFAGAFLGSHTFPYQSPLLSTIILNDKTKRVDFTYALTLICAPCSSLQIHTVSPVIDEAFSAFP